MKKEMPSTDALIEMAEEFDNFVIDFCEKYGLSPIETSGIFLARMTRLAEDMEYGPLYRKLLSEITGMYDIAQNLNSNNSNSIH